MTECGTLYLLPVNILLWKAFAKDSQQEKASVSLFECTVFFLGSKSVQDLCGESETCTAFLYTCVFSNYRCLITVYAPRSAAPVTVRHQLDLADNCLANIMSSYG